METDPNQGSRATTIVMTALVVAAGIVSLWIIQTEGLPLGKTAHELNQEQIAKIEAAMEEQTEASITKHALSIPDDWDSFEGEIQLYYPGEGSLQEVVLGDGRTQLLSTEPAAYALATENASVQVQGLTISLSKLEWLSGNSEVREIALNELQDGAVLYDSGDQYRVIAVDDSNTVIHFVRINGTVYEIRVSSVEESHQNRLVIMDAIIGSLETPEVSGGQE